jgi:hypothetical protein
MAVAGLGVMVTLEGAARTKHGPRALEKKPAKRRFVRRRTPVRPQLLKSGSNFGMIWDLASAS